MAASPPPAPPPHLTSTFAQTLLGHLEPFPLCPHCILRLCNVRSPSAYHHTPSALTAQVKTVLPSYDPPALCFACLNVLPSMPWHLGAYLASADYKTYVFSTFALTVSLAVTLTLRNLALNAHLASLLSHQSSLPTFDLKDATKVVALRCLSHITPHTSLPTCPPADVALHLIFSHGSPPSELRLMEAHTADLEHRRARKRYREEEVLSQSNLAQALPRITTAQLADLFASYWEEPTSEEDARRRRLTSFDWRPEFSFTLTRPPVLLMGSYIKHSRAISQSPWTVDSEDEPPPTQGALPLQSPAAASPLSRSSGRVRLTSTSVQEELTRHILPAFGTESARFSSSGREDLDVRMLGDGRPFVLEMQGVKRVLGEDEVTALQERVNRAEEDGELLVEVRRLRLIGKDEFVRMKVGVESKRKRYRCVVWCDRAVTEEDVQRLSDLRELTVQQRTPIRVLHRRSALVRQKVVHEIAAERMDCQWLRVDLVTSAGAYVKEFVHGDRGRTVPSLASLLGCACDCTQLDVMEVTDAHTHTPQLDHEHAGTTSFIHTTLTLRSLCPLHAISCCSTTDNSSRWVEEGMRATMARCSTQHRCIFFCHEPCSASLAWTHCRGAGWGMVQPNRAMSAAERCVHHLRPRSGIRCSLLCILPCRRLSLSAELPPGSHRRRVGGQWWHVLVGGALSARARRRRQRLP